MNYPKANWEKTRLWVCYIIALVIIIALVSCNPAKKLANDNEKAYQRVLTDSGMFRSIGDKWRKINPCLTDTIIGETEVLILSDTQYVSKDGKTDTLLQNVIQKVTNTVYKDRTKYIIDNKAINELQDSVHALQVREASHKGQILEKDKQLAQSNAKGAELAKINKYYKWGVIGFVFLVFLFIFSKFTPTITKIFRK